MLGRTTATLQRNVLNDLFDTVGTTNYKWVNRQQGELVILGRRIYCFGAANEDAETKIRGATFVGAYCDEVNLYPQNVFNQLMARLSIEGAMCFCNCNPDSPYHWFYTDYITNDEITDKKVWKFLMEDNLSLSKSYMESLKQMYTGVWYSRMILGQWVVAEGRVYDMFEPSKHMCDTQKAIADRNVNPRAIRWLVGCDYGTSTVMSWGLYAKLPDGTVFKTKEFYYNAVKEKKQKTDSEFAKDFAIFLGDTIPEAVYCDPSAASWKVLLTQLGYRVLNANNDVINGIRQVSSYLNSGKYFVDKSCINTEQEYASYVWDSEAQKRGVDKPVKEHDHACLTGDTLVWTTEGKKKLKDLTSGQCYCIDTTTNEVVVRDFYNARQTRPSAEVYEVELENGHKVRATSDHKILTTNGWKAISELTKEDLVGDVSRV